MAYVPFVEHDLETFEGDFRVVLLKHLVPVVPLQPEAWSPGLEIKRQTARDVRNHALEVILRSGFCLETFRAEHSLKIFAEKKVRVTPQQELEMETELKSKAFSSGGRLSKRSVFFLFSWWGMSQRHSHI